MSLNKKCPKCGEVRNFMSRKEIERGWCSSCEQKTWTKDKKEALSLALTIRAETQPINEHDDPGAIQDCWRSLLEILEDGEISLKQNRELGHLCTVCGKVPVDVINGFDTCPSCLNPTI